EVGCRDWPSSPSLTRNPGARTSHNLCPHPQNAELEEPGEHPARSLQMSLGRLPRDPRQGSLPAAPYRLLVALSPGC
ncbi:unnamed protein product, partial [Rangifer tarandus platyrhynchus]